MKSITTTCFTACLVTTAILFSAIGVRAADEELLFADIPMVYSAAKHEEPVSSTAAAVYVLTSDDIRRSGMTSIPELLRMVPGLDVAQVDANHWAISSRGFNGEFANKLLVLIDGRTVYGPFFGGVFWNVQDLPLEEIDRIEVIRGPGATLWGANAVNGVVNIITKEAKDTQGVFVSATYGSEEQPLSVVRYGGKLGTNLFYRAYVEYFDREHLVDSSGAAASDGWDATRGGFRVDWHASDNNALTLQGDSYSERAGETVDQPSLTPPLSTAVDTVSQNSGDNILGRWTHSFSKTSELTLQMYYDHEQEEEFLTKSINDTYDFDLQHRFSFGESQDISWGFGYRYLTGYANSNSIVALTPGSHQDQLFNVFLQDEITVIKDQLHLTIGSKLERNDFTGFEVEPSGRLAWTPVPRQTIWMAASRAVRTPDLGDRFVRLNESVSQPPASPPVLVSVLGNPDFQSEELTAYEVGYRIAPIKQLSFDLATFYNAYDRLEAYVPGTPVFELTPAPPHVLVPITTENGPGGDTYGAELLAEWKVLDTWKLSAAYTYLRENLHTVGTAPQDSPRHQFRLISNVDLPWHMEFNSAIYYVDSLDLLSGSSTVPIPAYVRLDLGLAWHPTKSIEIGIWGQNLLQDRHAEFNSNTQTAITEIPRSVLGRVTWHY